MKCLGNLGITWLCSFSVRYLAFKTDISPWVLERIALVYFGQHTKILKNPARVANIFKFSKLLSSAPCFFSFKETMKDTFKATIHEGHLSVYCFAQFPWHFIGIWMQFMKYIFLFNDEKSSPCLILPTSSTHTCIPSWLFWQICFGLFFRFFVHLITQSIPEKNAYLPALNPWKLGWFRQIFPVKLVTLEYFL